MVYKPFHSMELVERDQARDVADIKDALLKKKANECVALVPARESLATVDRGSLADVGVNFANNFLSGLESMLGGLADQVSDSIDALEITTRNGFEELNETVADGFDDVERAIWGVEFAVEDLNYTVKFGLERVEDQLRKIGYTAEEIRIILAAINETISRGFARLVKVVERNAIANEATAANTGALVKLQDSTNQGVFAIVDRLEAADYSLAQISGNTYAIFDNTKKLADGVSDIALSGRRIAESVQGMEQSLREANAVNIVGQLENMLTTKNYDGYTSIVENFIIRRRSISHKELMGIIADRTANNYIRIYAILKISEMGKGASLLIGVLSNQGEKERVRKLAKASLEKMGIKAVHGLSKCLKDPDLTIRRNAALFLFKLAKQSINIEKAGAALARTIAIDEDDTVRLYAVAAIFTALKKSQNIRGVYGLSSALFWSKNEEVKKLAGASLEIIGLDKVFGTLSANIKNSRDEQIRRYSASCLFNYYIFASGKQKELAEKKLLEAGAAGLPYLSQILKDKNANVRKEVLALLSKMNNNGISLESLFDQIIVATGDDEKVVRDAAVVLLCQIGAPALAPLTKMFNSNPQLALNAAVTIVNISNQEDPAAIKYLINSLLDTNLERRKCALSAIALAVDKGFKADAAALSLIPLLGDADNDVRITAEKALLGIKPALLRKGLSTIPHPSEMYIEVTQHDSPELVAFRNLLISPNVTARRRAAITLGKINDGYTLSCELMVATGDQDKKVRELAVGALVKIGERALPSVLNDLINNMDSIRRQNAAIVINEMARAGKDISPAVDALSKTIASDSNPVARQNAIYALWNTNEKGQDVKAASFVLESAISDPDLESNTRCYAARLLGKMIGEGNVVLKLLEKSVDNDERTRNTALETILMIGKDALLGLITSTYDEKAEIRQNAAATLAILDIPLEQRKNTVIDIHAALGGDQDNETRRNLSLALLSLSIGERDINFSQVAACAVVDLLTSVDQVISEQAYGVLTRLFPAVVVFRQDNSFEVTLFGHKLYKLLSSEQERTRAYAASLIGELYGGSVFIDAVARLLFDPSEFVRKCAEDAVIESVQTGYNLNEGLMRIEDRLRWSASDAEERTMISQRIDRIRRRSDLRLQYGDIIASHYDPDDVYSWAKIDDEVAKSPKLARAVEEGLLDKTIKPPQKIKPPRPQFVRPVTIRKAA